MRYRPRRNVSNAVVRVVLGLHDETVSVRNVTARGLRLQAAFEAEVEVDDPAVLSLLGHSFRAKVVWVTDAALGVAFNAPLSPSELTLFTGRNDKSASKARQRVGF